MSISIIIPTYEQKGEGAKYLTELLNSIQRQVITCHYEVIISDSSIDGSIKQVADKYPYTYIKNPNPKGASENINFAISQANYDKVKLMCQDDLFLTTNAIDKFYRALDTHGWVISNSKHINATGHQTGQRISKYTHGHFTDNTVGMPSVTAWRKCDVRFTPELKTVCDMYFYYQLYEMYGQPGLLQDFNIAQRYHNASLSRNQDNRHLQEVNWLIRGGKIPGTLPKVVICVCFHDRIENIRLWLRLWGKCEQYASLIIIHNDNGVDYSNELPGVTYLRRMNPIGFDIGAFADVCKNKLPVPQWDYLLWFTDDTVPVQPDFVSQYLDMFDKKTGIVCMHLSTEIRPHVRTTGFMITKRLSERLHFRRVTTREDCLQFEYKGPHSLYRQVVSLGYKIKNVAPLYRSPVYDMNYWNRNPGAIMLRHLLDRSAELDKFAE